jgi:hypothetical protein
MFRRRRQTGVLTQLAYSRPMLVALLVTMAMTTGPTTAADHLLAGEQAMEALEYEMATYEFMSVAVDPTATEAQRLQAHLRAGFAHRVLGKDTDARLSFRYVLQRAPQTHLPADTPPKVFFFFESVRQEIEADRGAGMTGGGSAPTTTGTTTTAPTTEPTTAPAATTAVNGPGGALVAGGLLATCGALAAITSGGFALMLEQQVGDPTTPGRERAQQLDTGRLSLVVAGVATLVGVVGGAMMVFGAAP